MGKSTNGGESKEMRYLIAIQDLNNCIWYLRDSEEEVSYQSSVVAQAVINTTPVLTEHNAFIFEDDEKWKTMDDPSAVCGWHYLSLTIEELKEWKC